MKQYKHYVEYETSDLLGKVFDSVTAINDELVEFVKEVRRSGGTRLASMAIAAIASVKGGAA